MEGLHALHVDDMHGYSLSIQDMPVIALGLG